jgi:hypothetical protein
MLPCITKNMNLNYNRIPCFVEKKSKQQLKYVAYQNRICGFLLQNTYNSSHFLKTVSNNLSSSLDLPSLGSPKSHHHDSKLTKIQNSKLQCSMSNPRPKCLVDPNHVIILPP